MRSRLFPRGWIPWWEKRESCFRGAKTKTFPGPGSAHQPLCPYPGQYPVLGGPEYRADHSRKSGWLSGKGGRRFLFLTDWSAGKEWIMIFLSGSRKVAGVGTHEQLTPTGRSSTPDSTAISGWSWNYVRGLFKCLPVISDISRDDQLGRPYDLGLLKKLFPYLWPWRRKWFLGLFLSVGLTLLDLIPPYLTKQALRSSYPGRGMERLKAFGPAVAPDSGDQLRPPVSPGPWSWNRWGQRVMHSLRLKLFSHLLSLPLSFSSTSSRGPDDHPGHQ